VPAPDEVHQQAIDQVRVWVCAKFPGCPEASAGDLTQSLVVDAAVGWRLPHDDGYLLLVLDRNFPYSEPRFVAHGLPDAMGGAHVEGKGRICAAGDGAGIDGLRPAKVVEHSYREAASLLESNKEDANDADFTLDFNAYWAREASGEPSLKTLINPGGPSRVVSTWSDQDITIIGDDKSLLTRFLRNMGFASNLNFQSGFAIWTDGLPPPSLYPKTVDNLRTLVKSRSSDGLVVLDELLRPQEFPIYGVFLGAMGEGRPVGAAGIAIRKKPNPPRPGIQVQDPLNQGFRRGTLPPEVMAPRLDLTRLRVDAVDEARSRRSPYLPASLCSKAVCLVGAGSLGAGIARLLLQSGVGKIALIDPDKLVWANIERHELGAQCVDQNKATALAATFQKNFPLAETEGYDKGWRAVYRTSPALLNEADLVVSTCADWNAESALSDLQRTKVLKGPVLYGWLEESALAAHAVALAADGPCLRCGFTATGGYLFPVVRAPTGPAVACGVGISLYGAIDLAPAQAMIAAVALDLLLGKAQPVVHRVLCCPQPMLQAAGGDWSPDWVAKFGAPPVGGTTVASEWPTVGSCICRS
jgi:sulfur-carrier protein adenylyltransferase/sulfurtransferase